MKRMILLLLIVVLLTGMAAVISSHPLVVHRCELPAEYTAAIREEARGVYSRRLPLLPVCISLENYTEALASYTIYYFPCGTVGMSYNQTDGFNQEKPLTRWQ